MSDRIPDLISIGLQVNGMSYPLTISPSVSLLDAIREYIGLTGTKKGCDHGQCGACTLLVDGIRINSCLTLAVMNDGVAITTVEGLSQGDELSPLQQAFIDHDAFQCGFCTSGQLCSATALLKENKVRTREDIQEMMSGNLCRCGAYPNITDAILAVKNNL